MSDVLLASAVYLPRRHHAQGGQGVVLAAHQEELNRTVAVKRIRPEKLYAATRRRRFLREAVITAQLQHPGVVPIYGLGHDNNGPFYSMPLIDGQTLEEAIAAYHHDEYSRGDPGNRSLRFRELLHHFITICQTIAYAHDQGVIHRDLKPSNVMLGLYGETLVMDWGLAKRSRGNDAVDEFGEDTPSPSPSSDDLTATGAVLGTPRYMSPEQAKGETVGPASDIFALGLILYAILTGKPAFDETNLHGSDPFKAVREATIVPLRIREPSLPSALGAICLKSLAARPVDRYPSARALAEDLSKWLADEPVGAYRDPFAERARRWVKRNRTAVTGATAALVVGLVGLAAVSAVLAQSNADLTAANANTQRALSESEESLQQARAVSAFLVGAFRSPDP
jgi:eukaryotic-like serine/threonine-protein kinase